jgi:formate--tetrahydrofolate ligase
VAINHFVSDTDAETQLLKQKVEDMGIKAEVCTHWANGGAGAEALAHSVLNLLETTTTEYKPLYPDDMSLFDKLQTIATRLYGAKDISFEAKAKKQLALFDEHYRQFPVCIAKTQYSFSSDSKLAGAPSDHTLAIREVRLSHGAEFIVAICGSLMTMPGLPKVPAAERIDIDSDGRISGLF